MDNAYEAKSQWLQERLLEYDESIVQRVKQTYRNYNNLIRNHIRTETALRFNTTSEDNGFGISIRVADDFSPAFRPIIEENDPQFWEIFLRQSLLRQTSKGLDFLDQKRTDLADLIRSKDDRQLGFFLEDIAGVKAFVDEVLAYLDYCSVLRRLKDFENRWTVESEVLGGYFYHDARIMLYWPTIAIIAFELGVSIESLTLVTLTHELVHAYTHLGQDTDSDRWDTEAFARTHLFIVEGLAQFYTELICKKLESRQPEVLNTFLKLREQQGEAYNSYQFWVREKPIQAEVIRFAMINCRKKQILDFDHFIDTIQATEHQISY